MNLLEMLRPWCRIGHSMFLEEQGPLSFVIVIARSMNFVFTVLGAALLSLSVRLRPVEAYVEEVILLRAGIFLMVGTAFDCRLTPFFCSEQCCSTVNTVVFVKEVTLKPKMACYAMQQCSFTA